MENSPNIISLSRAMLCVSCNAVSDTTGERCLACGCPGALLSLARILSPNSELGTVTYLYAGSEETLTDCVCDFVDHYSN
jgi:hypothetical protein